MFVGLVVDELSKKNGRTSIIQVYRYHNRQPEGTLENDRVGSVICFDHMTQLAFFLDDVYNKQEFPESDTERRSFFSPQSMIQNANYLWTAQNIDYVQSVLGEAKGEKDRRLREQTVFYGEYPMATFLLTVQNRVHSSWQGFLGWKEMGFQVAFRSFLELLYLMDEALLLVKYHGNNARLQQVLKERWMAAKRSNTTK